MFLCEYGRIKRGDQVAKLVWTKEKALVVGEEIARTHGRIPAHRWASERLHPSIVTLRILFGSWETFWDELKKRGAWQEEAPIDVREDILEKLKLVGHRVTMREWDDAGLGISSDIIRQNFPSWRAALDAAGLKRAGSDRVLGSKSFMSWPEDVQDIVRRYYNGSTDAEIGKVYGVTGQRIRAIVKKAASLVAQEALSGQGHAWHGSGKIGQRQAIVR